MRSNRGKTYISSGLLLPSKVTHLVIKRPPHFVFRPGDYVFVNIPTIAKYEWHPFTLSSAPEEAEHIWLHIRGVGEWTNRLYNFFEREQERLHNGEIPAIYGSGPTAEIVHERGASHDPTPQKTFLAQNMNKSAHVMHKANSFESTLHNFPKKVNESSKLATENYSSSSNASPPPYMRHMSGENKGMKKIQA
jgi:FAD-binding domain